MIAIRPCSMTSNASARIVPPSVFARAADRSALSTDT